MLFLLLVISLTYISLEQLKVHGPMFIVSAILIFYTFALLGYRLWLHFFNFETGYIEKGSSVEFKYQVYISIKLFLFNPIIESIILPTPVATLFYRLLGLKLGKNSYISGIVCDPHLVEIGSHSFTGSRSILVPHVMEDEDLAHYKIKIGNHVTVGTGATVLAGSEIGDFAIIAAQALILKNTKVGKYEIWGGVPAKKIGDRRDHLNKAS
jgi:acetyltransferase-like isoleucine patch superfamily enzyme